jgi:ubiquinone/menaquinone biosynthesis C-methylase UbiE
MKPLPSTVYNSFVNIFYNKRFLRAILKEVRPVQGMRILDVPCGTGILMHCCKPSFYVGADIDGNRVADAKCRYPRDKFVVSDATNLTFKNGKFDRILASGLFHHVDDAISLNILSEFRRVLATDGEIIVIEAIWPRNRLNLIGLVTRRLDQGKFVRHAAAYEKLFRQFFNIRKSFYFSNLGLEYLFSILVPVGGQD